MPHIKYAFALDSLRGKKCAFALDSLKGGNRVKKWRKNRYESFLFTAEVRVLEQQ